MSFLGRLFGTQDATKELVKSAKDGIDALFYTDQEKARDAMEESKEAYKVLIEWVKTNSGQNLARRIIALSCTLVWLSQIVISQIVKIYAVWSEVDSAKIEATAKYLDGGVRDMNAPMMLIFGFYFAAPHLHKFASAAADGMKRKV